MGRDKIYLDYAAATPVDESVLESVKPYFSHNFFNPSSSYLEAKKISDEVESSRSKIAEILSVKPEEIYFTAGGTEANNLAINGVMDNNPGKNLIISAIEHESISVPSKQYDYRILPVDKNGQINLLELEKLIDDNTVLISIMYANNEVGSIQPMVKVKRLIENIRNKRLIKSNPLPLYFHTDACQAANFLSLNASGIGVDMMTINGGKIYGLKQSGFLFAHRTVALNPQILGGGQEHGLRSGTENVPGIIGLSVALQITQTMREKESDRLNGLKSYFLELMGKYLPEVTLNGTLKNRLPNNLNFMFPDQDNETMLYKLDQAGIMCSTGSACSAQKDTLSPTLLAIGLSENQVLSSLRFSFGRQTTKNQVKESVEILKKILA